ncbi:MAG TPA: hypothetical protein VFV19_13155 [Candidatus Polarisedimenticolaceae bacterium]|nr:hypothetical protein [Candidatus Polarisedimenticolaceae bacterium]
MQRRDVAGALRRRSYPYEEALGIFCPSEAAALNGASNECTREWELAEELAECSGATLPSGGPSEVQSDPRNIAHLDFLSKRATAQDALLRLLRSGTLVATGFDNRTPASAGPVEVHRMRWQSLSVNLRHGIAAGPGFELTDLRYALAGTPRAQAKRRTTEWVQRLVAVGVQPSRKEKAMADANRELGTNYSRVAFIDAWRKFVPKSWKRSGPKSSITNVPAAN